MDNCGFLSGQELLRCCYLKKPALSPVINASCTSVHVDIKRSRDLPGFTRSSQLKAKVHQYVHCSKLRNSRINAKYSLFPTMKTRISVAKPHVATISSLKEKVKAMTMILLQN